MHKSVFVIGVAAAIVLAGCKDPDYVGRKPRGSNDEVKTIQPASASTASRPVAYNNSVPATSTTSTEATIETIETIEPIDNRVEPVATTTPDVAKPTTTKYIVQRGDTLSGISKRFNIKLDAIRRCNSLKGDVIRLGQTINLPGQVDVGAQTVPDNAFAKPQKKVYTPYTGETVDYKVSPGDTLGKIAYSNGINIRQLKELNGLTSDIVRVGQKLKIPAGNGAKATTVVAAKPKPASKPAAKVASVKSSGEGRVSITASSANEVEMPASAVTAEIDDTIALMEQSSSVAPAAVDGAFTSYTVQEGDDITGISIAFGISAAQLYELNNLNDGDQLKVGQVLKIPADSL